MSAGVTGQVIGLMTAAGGVSWLVSLVTVKASRKKILSEAGATDADAAEKIKRSALDLVAEMESDAKDARAEVRGLRVEIRRLEDQLSQAIVVGQEAIAELRKLKAAILDPRTTLEVLRDMAGRPGNSGHH